MKRIALAASIALCIPLSANAGAVPDSREMADFIRAQANATDSMQAMRDQQRAAAEDAQRARNAEAAAARAREEEARNSPQGHINGAEQQIRYCTARIAQARAALKRDDQIAKVSGVTNLALRNEAGSVIVDCQEQIDAAWREYRQYGGTAPSSAALVNKLIAGTQ